MNKSVSLYLDLCRLLAAAGVFLHHLNDWSGGRLPIFAPMQTHGVIVFFVISGFVIAYVATTRETSLTDFALNRAARIYSVAVPALLIGFGLCLLAAHLTGEAAPGPGALALQLVAALTFTNQIWSSHVDIAYNGPYWSLGYEVPYYVAFAAAFYGRGFWRWVLPLAAALLFGPRVTLLAGVWLMGGLAYAMTRLHPLSRQASLGLFCGSVVLLVLHYVGIHVGTIPASTVPIYWHRWELVHDFVVGALFAASLVGLSGMAMPHWSWVVRPIRWLAGATFTIYLLHYPIATFLVQVLKPDLSKPTAILGLVVTVLLACFVVAEWTERRKRGVRAVLAGLVARLSPKPSAALALARDHAGGGDARRDASNP